MIWTAGRNSKKAWRLYSFLSYFMHLAQTRSSSFCLSVSFWCMHYNLFVSICDNSQQLELSKHWRRQRNEGGSESHDWGKDTSLLSLILRIIEGVRWKGMYFTFTLPFCTWTMKNSVCYAVDYSWWFHLHEIGSCSPSDRVYSTYWSRAWWSCRAYSLDYFNLTDSSLASTAAQNQIPGIASGYRVRSW